MSANLPVYFISTYNLEHWDWTNPWTKGIGGSETCHIEMVQRLKSRGFNMHSFAPVPHQDSKIDPFDVCWCGQTYQKNHPFAEEGVGIFVYHRNPQELDRPKGPQEKWWFVAQDVDYPGHWTEERLAKVDRYICLCHEHFLYTLGRYPSLKGRIYTSSNGIRSDYIRNLSSEAKVERDPNRMLYPSSPDRGLKLLLEQWWRIREFNPDAKLAVAYGFNNMEIITTANPGDWRKEYQSRLEDLLGQPGIEVLGRVPQDRLYREWQKTGLWAHPTDFPETSCITCMEAQALGAFPVTNDLWALRDNVGHGWMVQGMPQKSELIRHNWLNSLREAMSTKDVYGWQTKEGAREEMREWALNRFDWERICDQWQFWIEKDMEAINA